MKIQPILKVAHLAAAMTVVAAMGVTPVYATAIYNRGTFVQDDFDHLFLRPNPNAYWYVEQMGVDANDVDNTVREVYCAQQTCVRPVEEENGDKYARFEVFPHTLTHSEYINANLSEDLDGADNFPEYANQSFPGPWNPSFGHPVVVESRFRFSANMNQDGSGTGHGTAGVTLWNNPFSQHTPGGGFNAYDLFGFTWVSDDSILIDGFKALAGKNTKPVFFVDLPPVDIHAWNTYKFVWSTDLVGNQTITYYVNGALVTAVALPVNVLTFQNMGLEVWYDNQSYILTSSTGTGRVSVTDHQYMDVDYVKIQKL